MNISANSIRILYRSGKITIEGVRDAMNRGWITAAEFKKITGMGV